MDTKTLIQAAIKALPGSYVPYSHFHVAAALLCKDQTVYTGINIEMRPIPPLSVRREAPLCGLSMMEKESLKPSSSAEEKKV